MVSLLVTSYCKKSCECKDDFCCAPNREDILGFLSEKEREMPVKIFKLKNGEEWHSVDWFQQICECKLYDEVVILLTTFEFSEVPGSVRFSVDLTINAKIYGA